jgi:hypothetical protein
VNSGADHIGFGGRIETAGIDEIRLAAKIFELAIPTIAGQPGRVMDHMQRASEISPPAP